MKPLVLLLCGCLLATVLQAQLVPRQDSTKGHRYHNGYFNSPKLLSEKLLRYDSSVVNERSFKPSTIDRYKQDPDFNYERLVEPPQSWWDRFWAWFWLKVAEVLSTPEGKTTLWTVFTLLAIAIIIYFINRVTGMNKTSLFGKHSGAGGYTTGVEDIHGISFDEEIAKAKASGDYRLALRLMYLKALKKMSDTSQISWQINKTNTDYLNETSGKTWFPVFRSLTFSFEYAWYGDLPLNKEHFTVLENQFIELDHQL
ncbi:hypothetical protein EXU57_01460 [Segetibacter sp. 3557_3]|uniref:hypothetical protein n=1 Tax=Segetibacter sp. 3557_3 TaxID=2547429 RepID=UPI0010585CAE|nr:hypothetical protein [Segetibacter sp. 3557_3]TDH28767.1 hypothetical protein EXU57_01460 [Segetibacter sp. 3557_3]